MKNEQLLPGIDKSWYTFLSNKKREQKPSKHVPNSRISLYSMYAPEIFFGYLYTWLKLSKNIVFVYYGASIAMLELSRDLEYVLEAKNILLEIFYVKYKIRMFHSLFLTFTTKYIFTYIYITFIIKVYFGCKLRGNNDIY